MTRIDAEWLNSAETQRVFGVLTAAGYQAFAVGGCVRNTLLGVPVSDIDIATSAPPRETLNVAERAGLKAVPTGFDHGTVTILVGAVPFEVTTFRRDIETDGRHAVVSFTNDIHEDARRRDFTMNALYADVSGALLDPLSGLNDLLARRVRFIEDADARIREDYLRSLRFFRFHAQYGDPSEGLDGDALSAIAANLDGLSNLAAERIGSEMLKLLAADDPAPALAGMSATGVLATILPGLNAQWAAPLVHLESEASQRPDALRRLAVLGGEHPEACLRLSKSNAKRVSQIAQTARDTMPLREVAWRFGADIAWSVILVRQALSEQALDPNTRDIIERATGAKLPIKANDLIENLSGPALGAALRQAEMAWIESDFELDREALMQIALEEG